MKATVTFCCLLVLLSLSLSACGSESTTAPAQATGLPPTRVSEPAFTPTPDTGPPPTATPEPAPQGTAFAAAETATAEPPSSPVASPTSGSFGSVSSTTTAGQGTSELSVVYEKLLRAIPDTPENRGGVFIEDFTMVRRTFDRALPGPGDSDASVQEFYSGLWHESLDPESVGDEFPVSSMGGTPFLGPYQVIQYGIAGNLEHLAFDIRDMDHSVFAGNSAEGVGVISGRFDPQATEDALGACTECPAHALVQHGQVSYYSWGEDLEVGPGLSLAPPAFDRLGRGGRLAVLDSYVLRALTTERMASMIDALAGETPAIADAEEFRLLGVGMSRLEVYRAMLSDVEYGLNEMAEGFTQGEEDPAKKDEAKRQLAGGAEPLRPFQAFATGAARDDDGPYMALTLVHSDDVSAEENVGLLWGRMGEGIGSFHQTPWSETIDIEGTEIWSEGRLLLAKLRGRISLSPFNWVFSRENLIVHE